MHAWTEPLISIDEYLAGEVHASVRHEYVGGRVYAMAGASNARNRIVGNLFGQLWSATRRSHCRTFSSDVRVRVADAFYYPDVLVCCEADDGRAQIVQRPCLIIEVLSASTQRIDQREKLAEYRRIETLKQYLLVSQDRQLVESWTRDTEGRFSVQCWYRGTESVPLVCPDMQLSLADIYEDVELDPAG